MVNRYIKHYLEYSPIVLAIVIVFLIAWGLSVNETNTSNVTPNKENYEIKNHTIDSLQNVVDSLQIEIRMLEDGFDDKEYRYEDVISEYEVGLSYLKDYHPNAYKDFHRIIGMKERYSNELKRENNKKLNQYKIK